MTPEDERLAKRKAFIDRHKHEYAGLILDGCVARTGGEMAFWARGIIIRTDATLGRIFDDLLPGPKPDLSKPVDVPIKQPPVKK